MFSIHTQNLVYVSEILSKIFMFKIYQNIRNYAMCFISMNEEKIRHFFGVLFVFLPYLGQEI